MLEEKPPLKAALIFRVDTGGIVGIYRFVNFYDDLREALAKRIDVLTTRQLDEKFLNAIAKEEIKIYKSIKILIF
ncbi:MAG: hypothetical protein LBP22_13835 [Deltaproteobacteria bacterium]|nr:hypothetical protein [Deltaproteobacteria bacterium]